MAQVASKFTMFTHHAKTFENLILSLRNSLLKTGVFTNEKVAEVQVVQVINFDIHLKRGFDGSRFIERITECVPVKETNPYTFDHRNEKTLEGKLDKFMDNATHYFTKVTETDTFKSVNIIEFYDGEYHIKHRISQANIDAMSENMSPDDQRAFKEFLDDFFAGVDEDMEGERAGFGSRRIIVE
jgi:pilus assembly protein CpaF